MDTFNGISNNLYVSFTSQTNPDCTFFSLRHLLLSALLLICLIFYILDFFLRGMWRFLHFYYLPSHNLTIFWRALLYRNCSCYIFTLLLFIYIRFIQLFLSRPAENQTCADERTPTNRPPFEQRQTGSTMGRRVVWQRRRCGIIRKWDLLSILLLVYFLPSLRTW